MRSQGDVVALPSPRQMLCSPQTVSLVQPSRFPLVSGHLTSCFRSTRLGVRRSTPNECCRTSTRQGALRHHGSPMERAQSNCCPRPLPENWSTLVWPLAIPFSRVQQFTERGSTDYLTTCSRSVIWAVRFPFSAHMRVDHPNLGVLAPAWSLPGVSLPRPSAFVAMDGS